jgi:hypothetical protein
MVTHGNHFILKVNIITGAGVSGHSPEWHVGYQAVDRVVVHAP